MRKEGSKTTSFIEKPWQWYRDRGLEDEFYRLYICNPCKFSHTCAGIHRAGVRPACTEYQKSKNTADGPPLRNRRRVFLEEKYNTLYRLRRGE